MTQQRKSRYCTTNWKKYNVALKAQGSLTVWLDKRMTCLAAASGKRGRTPKFSGAAIQFCLTLKNQFGLALRQTTGLVQSLLQLCGLAWPTLDFSTLCRRQLESEYTEALHTQPSWIEPVGEFKWYQVLGKRRVQMQKA